MRSIDGIALIVTGLAAAAAVITVARDYALKRGPFSRPAPLPQEPIVKGQEWMLNRDQHPWFDEVQAITVIIEDARQGWVRFVYRIPNGNTISFSKPQFEKEDVFRRCYIPYVRK